MTKQIKDNRRQPDHHYIIEDLNLACYLQCIGFKLEKIEGLVGWKKRFVLSPIPEPDIISAFYTGAKVSAIDFCNYLRTLKAAVRVGATEPRSGNA